MKSKGFILFIILILLLFLQGIISGSSLFFKDNNLPFFFHSVITLLCYLVFFLLLFYLRKLNLFTFIRRSINSQHLQFRNIVFNYLLSFGAGLVLYTLSYYFHNLNNTIYSYNELPKILFTDVIAFIILAPIFE